MTTDKIKVQSLASMRDAKEYELQLEHEGKTYIAHVEITGKRQAISNEKPIMAFLSEAKSRFKKYVEEGIIKTNDRFKFGYWAKGDFLINQNKDGIVNINGIVSKYSSDRLHIEIPKSYIHLFKEGEEISICKSTFD